MQLERDLEALHHASLGLAAISYDQPDVLRDFASRAKITYPLLSDAPSNVIRAYGVADRAYKKSDQMDLESERVFSGDAGMIPVYGLSYPAVFVLAPDGRVGWRFVSQSAEFRLTAAVIVERAFGTITNAFQTSTEVDGVTVHLSASNSSVSLGRRVIIGLNLTLPARVTASDVSWEMAPSRNCWVAGEPERKDAVLRRELVIRPVIQASDASVYERFKHVCLTAENQVQVGGTLHLEACINKSCKPESIPLSWKFDFVPPDLQRVPEAIRRENATH